MIKINTVSPTKTLIEECDISTLDDLRKALTYKDTSVSFNLKKLKENKWLQANYPDTYRKRLKELEKKISNCMLKYDTQLGKHWFNPGSIPYLKGFSFEEINNIKYPEVKKIPWRKI